MFSSVLFSQLPALVWGVLQAAEYPGRLHHQRPGEWAQGTENVLCKLQLVGPVTHLIVDSCWVLFYHLSFRRASGRSSWCHYMNSPSLSRGSLFILVWWVWLNHISPGLVELTLQAQDIPQKLSFEVNFRVSAQTTISMNLNQYRGVWGAPTSSQVSIMN